MRIILLTTLAAAWLVGSSSLVAQATPPDVAAKAPAPARPHVCFRGRPLPRCSAFWITEFGLAARLTPAEFANGPLYTWELGGMKNRGTRNALGAALFVEGSDEGGAWGLRPRYRRWLNPKTTLDLAPGIAIGGDRNLTPGFSGHVALNFADYFALTSTIRVARRYEYVPATLSPAGYPLSYTEVPSIRAAWFGGARLGALPGTIVGVAIPTAVIVTFLIVCGRGACFD